MRVLFADDQLPDSAIPDAGVLEAISARYPQPGNRGFVNAFRTMRQAYNAVSAGNEVTVANRYQQALELIRTQVFDVAIIDLGWWADSDVQSRTTPDSRSRTPSTTRTVSGSARHQPRSSSTQRASTRTRTWPRTRQPEADCPC